MREDGDLVGGDARMGHPFPTNRYLEWRGAWARAREGRLGEPGGTGAGSGPGEGLLQQVWRHQRLRPGALRTAEGTPVRVWHPGFWNREPGPDFREAILQFGAEPARVGDVEIDVEPGGWEGHGHAGNPAYGKVILQATWRLGSARRGGKGLERVALAEALDAPLEELEYWLGTEGKGAPAGLAGRCAGPLRSLGDGALAAVLRQAAQARLRQKALGVQAAARELGWEGALAEGLFGALGYKHNVWPMRQVARGVAGGTTEATELGSEGARVWQARLFGVAGFLEAHRESREEYVRGLWDGWWREAERWREAMLPPGMWRWAGVRPANHPERRLALAGHWLGAGDLATRLEEWGQRGIGGPDLAESLLGVLQARDDFWERRWTLRSKAQPRGQPLLGAERATDLAMNVILPWLYVRAWASRNERLAARAEERYFLWPAGEDNAVLRRARERLFGGERAGKARTAAEQQGLMQIVRDFCEHSNAACEGCGFPGLVEAVGRG